MAVVYVIGPREFVTGDTNHYLAMVRGELAPSPFAYRLATPAIVSALPWEPSVGFFLIASAATFGTLWVMRAIFRHLGVSAAASTVTAVLLCFSFPVAHYLAQWGRIDALANFFFALSLLLILRRLFLPAALVMALGILVKESLLFLLPILVWHRIRGRLREPRSYASAVLLSALPILTWASVRATAEIREWSFVVDSPEDLVLVVQSSWDYNVEQFGLARRVARDLTKSYSFVWALAAFGLLIDRRLRLENLYLVVIGFLLCFVAGDWARMLGTGFPGIFIPAAFFVDRLSKSRSPRPVIAGLLSLSVLHCYLALLIYRDLPRPGQIALVVGELTVLLAGVGLAVWGYLETSRRVENSVALIESR